MKELNNLKMIEIKKEFSNIKKTLSELTIEEHKLSLRKRVEIIKNEHEQLK
jgi:hypothetical protein